MSLSPFKTYLLEGVGLSELTVKQYLSCISVARKRKTMTEVLADKDKSRSTKNCYWCALRSWARFTEDKDLLILLDKPSTAKLVKDVGGKLPRITHPLSKEDHEAFYAELGKYKQNTHSLTWPVLSMLIKLGLRARVDLCGLQRKALIEAQKTGRLMLWTKRGKVRSLPSGSIVEEMDRLLEHHNWVILADLITDSGPSGSENQFRGAYQAVLKEVKKIAKAAGLDDSITPHRFRHSFARHVYELSNGNLVMVKQALGHASINTTQIYLSTDELALSDLLMEK